MIPRTYTSIYAVDRKATTTNCANKINIKWEKWENQHYVSSLFVGRKTFCHNQTKPKYDIVGMIFGLI